MFALGKGGKKGLRRNKFLDIKILKYEDVACDSLENVLMLVD